MSVAVWVGKKNFEVGSSSFLKSYFSTIFVRLEDQDWGSRFPVIMNKLYMGSVPHGQSREALAELETIRREFADKPPADVVWDFENLEARPPWDDDRAENIHDLSTEFVTSDGKNLFDVLNVAFRASYETRKDVRIS